MNLEIFEIILKHPLDVLYSYLSSSTPALNEIVDSQGLSLLHSCIIGSKVEQMQVLLHFAQTYPKPVYNTWINRPNKEGLAPLLFAVTRGNIDAARLLVQFNANIYATTPLGLDAIHLCAQGNNTEIFVFFYELRCSIQNTDNKGGTPLHWAAYMGSFNMLSLLLTLGAKKNAKDIEGRTPLHLAVMSANEKNVRKLIVYGANTEIQDKKNRTPLKIAMEADSKSIINMLRELTFIEIITCKNKLRRPIRSSKHLVALVLFLTFSFVFVVFFCIKKNNVGTYIFIGIVVSVICNLFYLISSNPGYVALPKSYNLQELYRSNKPDVCPECKLIRPLRSRHCFYCSRCITRYDHHCQWINNCVGVNNNNMFFIFLFTLILLCIIVDYIAIEVFISPSNDGILKGKNSLVPAGIIIFISSLVLYPITLLLIIQVKNYSKNKTSSERLSKNRKKHESDNCFMINCFKMCIKQDKA